MIKKKLTFVILHKMFSVFYQSNESQRPKGTHPDAPHLSLSRGDFYFLFSAVILNADVVYRCEESPSQIVSRYFAHKQRSLSMTDVKKTRTHGY